MRLVIVTQWFDPEPTIKGVSFARGLVERGYAVEVITGFPNYPTGRVYPGYRLRLFKRELIDGVVVTRLPLYPSHGASIIGRVANYASFAISVAVYGLFFMRRADVIYAYHPPLTVGLASVLIGGIRRVPIVYDIQDLWPDTLSATGMIRSSVVLSILEAACRFVYRFVDEIAVLSLGFKKALVSRGVPEDKITVIHNWADEQTLRRSPRCASLVPSKSSAEFLVVYAGNIGKAQGLEAVLDATQYIGDISRRVRLMLVGDGIERCRLESLAKERGYAGVEFVDPVPFSEIGPFLARADALLVHLSPDPLFEITIPSKTQAYLCIGRPVIMAVGGEAADLIVRSGGGVVAKPGDPVSIASAISSLAALSDERLFEIGARGRRFYDEELGFNRGLDHFAELFSKSTSSPP